MLMIVSENDLSWFPLVKNDGTGEWFCCLMAVVLAVAADDPDGKLENSNGSTRLSAPSGSSPRPIGELRRHAAHDKDPL